MNSGISYLGNNRIKAFVCSPEKETGYITSNDLRFTIARMLEPEKFTLEMNRRISGEKPDKSDLTNITIDVAHSIDKGEDPDAKGVVEKFEVEDGCLYCLALLQEDFYNDIAPKFDEQTGEMVKPAKFFHTSMVARYGDEVKREKEYPTTFGREKFKGMKENGKDITFPVHDIISIERISLTNNPAATQTITLMEAENCHPINKLEGENTPAFDNTDNKENIQMSEENKEIEVSEISEENIQDISAVDRVLATYSEEDKAEMIRLFSESKSEKVEETPEEEVTLSENDGVDYKAKYEALESNIKSSIDFSDIVGEEKFKLFSESLDAVTLMEMESALRGVQSKSEKSKGDSNLEKFQYTSVEDDELLRYSEDAHRSETKKFMKENPEVNPGEASIQSLKKFKL